MSRRRMSQNKRIYNLKEVDINKPSRYALVKITEIMDLHKLTYDCNLYDVTRRIEEYYPRIKDQERWGMHTTGEILKALAYIKDNDLLRKGLV